MESVFIIIVGILFLLAVLDLIVGVSNDAVNFLVSAIGSNAAPFRVVMIVASMGVLVGAVFSGGMMEVARKGIFHPDLFSFNEIIIIFLTVMLTDVILLDVFNSLGMPTSTTVSLVFELLGSAVAMSIVVLNKDGRSLSEVGSFINSEKALVIIGGILFSVVVAFSIGAIVQYLSRLLFSFEIKRAFNRYGAIWGGLAVTAITYFTLIQGIKDSIFSDIPFSDTLTFSDWINSNISSVIGLSFIAWVGIMALLQYVFKINTLKLIVLFGTFSLAMSFAGNDLVNFIGVPLAGFESYKAWASSGLPADSFMMEGLTEAVKTPTLFLILAGIIMVITLWFSKKAKTVTETSLNLSRQSSGAERFESTALSRNIVRTTIQISKIVEDLIPPRIRAGIEKKFSLPEEMEGEIKPTFDLIRAAVNLMVSGVLISIGTAYKLPLSTTYVTFMVAMGTSLTDRAWGRESAVYRVSGVIAVVAGWFITAIVAFTAAFLLASLISLGGIIAISLIVMLAGVSMIRSQIISKKKKTETVVVITEEQQEDVSPYENCKNNVIEILGDIPLLYKKTIRGLIKEDRKKLKSLKKQNVELNSKTKEYKDNVFITVQKFAEKDIHSGPYFVQVLDYLREIAHALYHVVKPTFEHIDNNHTSLKSEQIEELNILADGLSSVFTEAIDIIKTESFDRLAQLSILQKTTMENLDTYREHHINRIKKNEITTRNSVLYLDILAETKNILLYITSLTKAQRDFVIHRSKVQMKPNKTQ